MTRKKWDAVHNPVQKVSRPDIFKRILFSVLIISINVSVAIAFDLGHDAQED